MRLIAKKVPEKNREGRKEGKKRKNTDQKYSHLRAQIWYDIREYQKKSDFSKENPDHIREKLKIFQ